MQLNGQILAKPCSGLIHPKVSLLLSSCAEWLPKWLCRMVNSLLACGGQGIRALLQPRLLTAFSPIKEALSSWVGEVQLVFLAINSNFLHAADHGVHDSIVDQDYKSANMDFLNSWLPLGQACSSWDAPKDTCQCI